jgi:Zn-dependent protease
MAKAGITINVVLMILNLLPLPPLDGGRITTSLLPDQLARPYSKLERYGFVILIVLLFSGVLSKILEPFINAAYRVIFSFV